MRSHMARVPVLARSTARQAPVDAGGIAVSAPELRPVPVAGLVAGRAGDPAEQVAAAPTGTRLTRLRRASIAVADDGREQQRHDGQGGQLHRGACPDLRCGGRRGRERAGRGQEGPSPGAGEPRRPGRRGTGRRPRDRPRDRLSRGAWSAVGAGPGRDGHRGGAALLPAAGARIRLRRAGDQNRREVAESTGAQAGLEHRQGKGAGHRNRQQRRPNQRGQDHPVDRTDDPGGTPSCWPATPPPRGTTRSVGPGSWPTRSARPGGSGSATGCVSTC